MSENPVAPMFQPLRLRDMELANRAVVSPMCMYSAKEGVPGDFHFVHYGSRAIGGAGLIFTEMTCVGRDARITPGCAGLWNDEQQAAWRRIVDFVHANSAAKICLQLGHAGRKGATKLMWDGMDRPLEAGRLGRAVGVADPVFSRQPGAARNGPRRDGPRQGRVRRCRAARRACGFDMLELHCAHGYLLASFISPLTNQRSDEYGGSLENRLRYPLEIFAAMRAAWPAHKPMSVRISATDWAEGGITGDDAVKIARAFGEAGVDLVDVSTGQTVRDAQPIYGRMFQTPFSDQVRNEARVATMCVGNITTADQVNTILAAGRADLVALGRPHLVDPSFTLRAAAWYGARYCLPAAISAGQGADFPQQRARPPGFRRAEDQGQAEDAGGTAAAASRWRRNDDHRHCGEATHPGLGDAGCFVAELLAMTDGMTRTMTILDSETKAGETPEDHGDELRLWLRLLTCTTLIEGEVRSRLRERFDVTLPRFDLMAQLDKAPDGMTLSDVSKRMMVSNGNVTGLVERLCESGHLDRRTSDQDRRVQVIRLTKAGRAEFRKMAAEHEIWIADMFSDLGEKDVRDLMRLLAKTKLSARKARKTRRERWKCQKLAPVHLSAHRAMSMILRDEIFRRSRNGRN